ncbi:low affinity potassium transporter [Elasticomyces elasticus]|nr:low affinity potassium transporter [Elasticomyces elasticus]
MVFEGTLELAGKLVRLLNPKNWHKPHPNFITVHYCYIIGCALIGSILVYPAGGLHYIDALFFTAGASTQAGLNTVNTNDLYLYQQIVIMLLACIANPIFINSTVVFVRLYWFEKRFQNMVKDAQSKRKMRSRTMSRSRTEMSDVDPSALEMGINGRDIRVLHESAVGNGMNGNDVKMSESDKRIADKLGLGEQSRSVSPTPESSNRGSNHSDEATTTDEKDHAKFVTPPQSPVDTRRPSYLGLNPGLRREITFADELPTPRDPNPPDIPTVSERRDLDKHIRFLEQQQRTAKDKEGTLRIPGPRDFDRGDLPAEVDDGEQLTRPMTRDTDTDKPPMGEMEHARRESIGSNKEELNADDHPPRAITFNEPDHPVIRGRVHGARALDSVDEADAQESGFRHTLSRVKSNITHRHNRSQSGNGPHLASRHSLAKTFTSLTTARTRGSMEDPMPYLSWQATIGRNSAFLGLSEEQREELGGIEYRALKTLAKILVAYYVGFHIFGMVIFLPWILHVNGGDLKGSEVAANGHVGWREVVQNAGTNPAWWGVWTPSSMFNDLGLTLTPDSMNSFNNAPLPLLVGSFLIVIGNTGFPCMLRFAIWAFSKFVPHGTGLWEELKFLLDHPRRCFTLLFPARATWWLFGILAGLNILDLVLFIILDLNSDAVTSLPVGYRVLDGWFQSTSTRTAGFSCVNLALLHPAIQVSYMIMMYISVFPIAISVRRTNVYEEKSLGIWGGEEDAPNGNDEQSYVGQHLRRQLSFDLWYVFLGFFIICIVEGARLVDSNIEGGEYAFTMFSVLFEIVSAYGTVGLSLGYPTISASFSAEFHTLSKLVIIAMMIRGRHRGLPYALDRAILLPSDNKKKDAALDRTMTRRMSLRPGETWEDGELDESGLPKQHSTAQAMGMGAGGETSPEGGMREFRRRRSSGLTHASGREGSGSAPMARGQRRRSFSVLAGGLLSAGPTIPRDYE